MLLSVVWFSCEKELNITDFSDEFGNYQPELKIEGLLKQDKPEDSIIRIIRTSVITDNDLYNGIDDDGDGEIDEEDEIIAVVQDMSATVIVRNLNSGDTTHFDFVAIADSIEYEDKEDGKETIYYGGYKTNSGNFQIENFAQYQVEIYSQEFDKTIIGTTTIYPPVEFIDTLYTFQDSTIFMNVNDEKKIFWKSHLDITSYYVSVEELIQIGATEWHSELIYSHPSTRDNDLYGLYPNRSVGREILFGMDYPIYLKFTVKALSPEYGQYIFSSLPLKDPKRSNLRDEEGNPVMGCFGAIASKSIYIEIQ